MKKGLMDIFLLKKWVAMSVKTQSAKCQQYNKYIVWQVHNLKKYRPLLGQLVFEFLSFVIDSNFLSPSFFFIAY